MAQAGRKMYSSEKNSILILAKGCVIRISKRAVLNPAWELSAAKKKQGIYTWQRKGYRRQNCPQRRQQRGRLGLMLQML